MTTKFTNTCPECGLRYATSHLRKLFCSTPCQKAYSNRDLSAGQRNIALAKAWRAGRSIKDPALRQAAKDAFSLMCRELDILIAADRDAGRMHPTLLFLKRERDGRLDHHGPLSRR